MDMHRLGKIPRKRIDQAGIALTLLVAVVLSIAFLGRGVTALQHLGGEEKKLVQRLAYLTQVADMLGQGEETLAFLRKRSEQLNQQLPGELDYHAFYATLAQSADRHGVNLIEVSPDAPLIEPNYIEMPIQITAETSYESLYAFLNELVVMPRLIKINELEVSMTDAAPVCLVEADLRIYALNEDANDG